METMKRSLEDIDADLAQRYGDYAGYDTEAAPYLIETYGEEPENEVKRLLGELVQPHHKILDVGCGAGKTLCQFASQVAEGWGIDEDPDLLESAHARVEALGLSNITLKQINIAHESEIAQLPNGYFDIAFCESGPGINATLADKLSDDALFIQEIGGGLGSYLFQEIMGRKPYTYYAYGNNDYSDQTLLNEMAMLDLVPVSVKNYFYTWYFRDVDHLEAQLINVPWHLGDWKMGGPLAYEPKRDRVALELYANYNMTEKGIRFQEHLRVFMWRREKVHFYPAGSLL